MNDKLPVHKVVWQLAWPESAFSLDLSECTEGILLPSTPLPFTMTKCLIKDQSLHLLGRKITSVGRKWVSYSWALRIGKDQNSFYMREVSFRMYRREKKLTQKNSIMQPRIFVISISRGKVDRITVKEFSLKVFLQSSLWENWGQTAGFALTF